MSDADAWEEPFVEFLRGIKFVEYAALDEMAIRFAAEQDKRLKAEKELNAFRSVLLCKQIYCDQIEKETSREIRDLREQLAKSETKVKEFRISMSVNCQRQAEEINRLCEQLAEMSAQVDVSNHNRTIVKLRARLAEAEKLVEVVASVLKRYEDAGPLASELKKGMTLGVQGALSKSLAAWRAACGEGDSNV